VAVAVAVAMAKPLKKSMGLLNKIMLVKWNELKWNEMKKIMLVL